MDEKPENAPQAWDRTKRTLGTPQNDPNMELFLVRYPSTFYPIPSKSDRSMHMSLQVHLVGSESRVWFTSISGERRSAAGGIRRVICLHMGCLFYDEFTDSGVKRRSHYDEGPSHCDSFFCALVGIKCIRHLQIRVLFGALT